MALSTVLRFPGLPLGETVAGVAGAACPRNPIGVDTADPRVGPRGGIELPTFQNLDLGAVTLPTTNRHGGGAPDNLSQVVVQSVEDLQSLGVTKRAMVNPL
jgi:hypothetical protein